MSSNQNPQSTTDTSSTGLIQQHEITLDMLQKPGVVFKAGGCLFISTGGPGGVNVIRASTGDHDELNASLLEEDIENGDVELVNMHCSHTEVGVNRTVLATLIDYVQEDMDSLPERVPSDVAEAADDARERLQ